MPSLPEDAEELPLSQAAQYLLDECRMVLPGIQALFGFQLIVVFSPGFDRKLDALEQNLHLVALGLAAVAVAIIMAPAALHRHSGARKVSETFVQVSTRLLLWSMIPLALSICLDSYLIGRAVIGQTPAAAALATALFGVFVLLWFVLPRSRRLQAFIAGRS